MISYNKVDTEKQPKRSCKSCGRLPYKVKLDFYTISAKFGNSPQLSITLCIDCLRELKNDLPAL